MSRVMHIQRNQTKANFYLNFGYTFIQKYTNMILNLRIIFH